MAVAREPEQIATLAELLLMFKPVSLARSELATVPVCRTAVGDAAELTPVLQAAGNAR
jgi:hypothetical protein